MYRKKFKRNSAMILALAILVGLVPAMGAEAPAAGDPFAAMYDSDAVFLMEAERIIQMAARSGGREPGGGWPDMGSSGISEHLRDSGQKRPGNGETRSINAALLSGFKNNKSVSDIAREFPLDEKTAEQLERLYDRSRADRFIVKYKGATAASSLLRAGSMETIETTAGSMQLLTLPERVNPRAYADELRQKGLSPQIEYIQLDLVLEFASFGLDYEEIQGAYAADSADREEAGENRGGPGEAGGEPNLPEANGLPVASNEVIVALIDTGVQISHPLILGRVAGGWNFVDDNDDVCGESNPMAAFHATHICGIITNNSPDNVKVMPLKVFGPNGAFTSDILKALTYAESNGAKVANMSFGSNSYNPALRDAIAGSSMLIVAAVGNGRADLSAQPVYPASFGLGNTISVASLNEDKGFSFYSGYSASIVDIAARGRDVESSAPGGGYARQSGTSMAAGFVSAAAALVLSYEDMGAAELKERIVQAGDMYAHLGSKVIDGRSLNAGNALAGVEVSHMERIDHAPDFDVHGYVRTGEENWQLFSSTGTVQVAAAGNHTLVLKANGSVWTFGDNVNYSLSPGCTVPEYYTAPEEVIGLTNIVKIAAGETHNLAIRYDGSIWAWGDNTYGQLGDGTYAERFTPVQAIGIMGAVDISAGYYHSLTALSGGEVYGMGDDSYSQLSAGSSSPAPVQIPGPSGAVYVHADGYRSLAAEKGGCVWVWGDDYSYNGSAVSIAELEGSEAQVGITIKPDKSVWTWEMQPGKYGIYFYEDEVQGLSGIVEISGGSSNSLALKNDGTVWQTDWETCTQVIELENIVSVANGYGHYLALDISGGLWAWGDNTYGQLGDGTTTSGSVPALVTMPLNSGISFDSAGYSVAIPKKGSSGIGMTATAYDLAGQPIPNAAISYSLASPYPGVSINASTGDVSVDSTTLPGTVAAKADYQGLFATTLLELKPYDTTIIELSVAQNGEYRITLSASDVPTFIGKAITIRYDPKELQLMDAAEHVYGTYNTPGAIPGTGITVTSITPGALELAFEKFILSGSTWSGVITVIKFKALTSGTVFVSVE